MNHKKTLSNREQQVVELLLEGLSYTDIARRLVVERCTVLTHILHIFEKLDVTNRWQIMTMRIHELENEVKELQEKVKRAYKK